MKASTVVFPLTMLLGSALGVDMSKYEAEAGVEASFKPFLQALYASAEDYQSTNTFTDFFVPKTGRLIVLENNAEGAQAIVQLKQALLPTTGTKHWNHLPNITSVYSETTTEKTYNVFGLIQSIFDGGNCSAAYYSSRFTVLKDSKGNVRNQPHSGSLVAYDDYVVSPSKSPTDIPC
ncbi:hypothetical protein CGRA01v4_04369 [Colletotrichum graminicola]|uniref:SnoaL-like domain-containing protein n=1 Tax=Colletotrichum graminicola (strain M1.001 / M2 / FGSC 10212) TaxID=645133 RepID=E3Q9D0_COLGM|nr:uncharacterized protein GLRG_01804 [Colletotrichum graminicola M1.001]EFQ27309.1 hypothetical protein GLRG_01804 [Colletotrichum graminicola M1.001]WDK13088.1 hypothetical protein CGRA01v4_04369 [Colletotrichum graminicola]